LTPTALNISALILPWLALLIHAIYFRTRSRLPFAIVGVVGMYALLLLSVHVLNKEIAETLRSFDLNGDGGFSGHEITPAQEMAMDDYTSDTGRAMAPITGAVFSILYAAAVLLLWFVAERIACKFRGNRI
jgi:hypothetical protein